MGALHVFRRQWEMADAEFNEAMAIQSYETRDHGGYGHYLLGRGEYEKASELVGMYTREYGDDVIFLRRAALYLYHMRRYAEADKILHEISELDKNLWLVDALRVFICLAVGKPKQALSHMRRIKPLTGLDLWPGLHILCLAEAGNLNEARAKFKALEIEAREHYVQPLQMALGCMALAKPVKAIEWLSRGCDEFEPLLLWLHLWPVFDPLRKHTEFVRLIKRIGLPKGV